jgi:glyoxylase-like metal-dependent hydrolase (beta-lactamase superfamily II)
MHFRCGPLLHRRALLAGLGAASLLPPHIAMAAPHRFKIGDLEITVISDGYLTVPTRFLARNVTEAEIKAWLAVTADRVTPPCNVTLVRTPAETILIDVGAGPHYMPGAGMLAENLEAAGIDRTSITKVVFTHAHPDHLWGVLDDFDDAPMFPNASYVISTAELNFWMAEDVASRLPEDRQNLAAPAKRSLRRIKEKLQTVEPGQEIASGIHTIDTSGHTQGHLSIEIASGSDAVLVVGDAITHPTISFGHPEWMPAADHHDPQRAVAVRKSLLEQLATDRHRIIGFHLPFPGIGTVERIGTAYRFVPTA